MLKGRKSAKGRSSGAKSGFSLPVLEKGPENKTCRIVAKGYLKGKVRGVWGREADSCYMLHKSMDHLFYRSVPILARVVVGRAGLAIVSS